MMTDRELIQIKFDAIDAICALKLAQIDFEVVTRKLSENMDTKEFTIFKYRFLRMRKRGREAPEPPSKNLSERRG
jgi:hypothetical protein